MVNGDREAVETLLHDGRVKAISFVGSTPVAEHIYHTGCGQNKRVQALGGAKNHAVVLPDADIPGAVGALMGAAFGSCGQRCMAIPLVVAVGDGTADALIAGLRQQMAAMRVPVAYHSFGGWKRSLFGDLHAYGPDAVRFYTKRKTITQRWPASGDARRASFSFPSGQG